MRGNVNKIDSIVDKQNVEFAIEAEGLKINDKDNLVVSNRGLSGASAGDKVNIESMGSIQIKPGMKSSSKSAEIALDNEFNTKDPKELKVKVCNGAKDAAGNDQYSKDTMALKLTTAKLILDNKNANDEFDDSEMIISFQNDTASNRTYAKLKARAFDLRCHDHGGIALQPCGKDSSNVENKIKFESSRTNAITETNATFADEGGKGLEFGTFNNEHSSLFTKDYRFNKDGLVFAVKRNTPVETSGKFDYPTQKDDFKDVVNPNLIKGSSRFVTWADIIASTLCNKYNMSYNDAIALVNKFETSQSSAE